MSSLGILIPIIVVSVPIFGMALTGFKRWAELKERQMELQSQATAEKTAQYAAHTERLEQRVRVLERIVTDTGFATATEIDRLRDESLN
jgi:putative intracellular protease/amidase